MMESKLVKFGVSDDEDEMKQLLLCSVLLYSVVWNYCLYNRRKALDVKKN